MVVGVDVMLELKNISFQVQGNKEILKNINLTIGDSRFVVITGPNGGGKSTLARVIAGIEKPQGGQILLRGQDITGIGVTERAQLGIAYAFQQPVRFKGLTVRDLLNLASPEPLEEKQLRGCLRDVGLCVRDYIDREVNASLSGGEIKRIEIAMVTVRRAPLTIFDEPEAGIDLWSFGSLIDVFRRMRRETQGSILIISHQKRILEIADEIVVLSGGKIVAKGGRDKVMPELFSRKGRCAFCEGREETSHE